MPYYQGDFYPRYPGRGDFLGALGGIAKSVLGFIPGVGPALAGLIPTAAPKVASAALPMLRSAPASLMKMPGQAVSTAIKVAKGHPVLTAAGAAGALGAAAGVGGHMLARHIMGGNGKRHRRMRVTNPKALRRSLRRVQGFSHLALKVLRITHPQRRGKVAFRFKKRRKTI